METIKASELRIGNYYNHNGQIKTVTPNTILEVWEAERTWCKPIPLTEEILLKNLGFKKSSWGWIKNGVNIQKGFTLAFSSNKDSIEIKYLHQLQNLYFALTGQELEFKQ
jgi:hypothetical protein